MIDIKDLDFGYVSATPLFHKLTLSLPSGTICGILGANGAGKSTLLKLLTGLIFPGEGRCKVFGRAPGDRRPEFLTDIFLVPEEVFVAPVTPAAYARRYGQLYSRFDQQTYDQLLADFSLPTDRKVTTYSYGQRKKFLLAFGIATNARLLIMDEPTNGLDIPGKIQFRRALINHFAADRSILISTHQVHDLQGLIDSVVVISDGRILLNSSLEALTSRLRMQLEQRVPEGALYAHETLEGFRVITENTTGSDAELDLETLFGFATSGSARLNQVLAKPAQAGDRQ